jgi:hypothetical protein
VERYFNRTGKLVNYWLGLSKQGFLYFWQDGTSPGTGGTSNSNPYGMLQAQTDRNACAEHDTVLLSAHPLRRRCPPAQPACQTLHTCSWPRIWLLFHTHCRCGSISPCLQLGRACSFTQRAEPWALLPPAARRPLLMELLEDPTDHTCQQLHGGAGG